jgi:Tol biopolymer transport system component
MIRFPKLLGLLLAVNIISLGGCSDAGFVTPPQQLLGNTLNTPSSEDNPRFNYDGRYLVFASDSRGQRTIYLFDRVANRLVPLPGLNQAKPIKINRILVPMVVILFMCRNSPVNPIYIFMIDKLCKQKISPKIS